MQPVFFPNQLATSLLLQPSYLLPSSLFDPWDPLGSTQTLVETNQPQSGDFRQFESWKRNRKFWGRTKGWKPLGFLPKKIIQVLRGFEKKLTWHPKRRCFFCCCFFSVFGNSLGCDLKKTLAQKL